MTTQIVDEFRLLYEAVYNDNLRELSEQYNNSLFFNDIPEFALEYFYAIGLNDDGISILAESLGFDEFTDWIFDIDESPILSEARRGPGGSLSRIEPVTAKGEKFKKTKTNPKGLPKGKSLERLRRLKAERTDRENRASEEKPSGLTAALRSQAAISAAAKQKESPNSSSTTRSSHPLDPLARVILKGLDRDRQARQNFKKSEAGQVLRKIGIGARKAGRFAGRALDFGLETLNKEFSEDFEFWVNDLIEEGYDLSDYTWGDMWQIYESAH